MIIVQCSARPLISEFRSDMRVDWSKGELRHFKAFNCTLSTGKIGKMENENVDGLASKTKPKPKKSKAEQSLKKCAKMSEKLAVKSQQLVLWSYGPILWSPERVDKVEWEGGDTWERDKEQSVVQPSAMATPAPLTAKRGVGQFVVGCGCGIECGL